MFQAAAFSFKLQEAVAALVKPPVSLLLSHEHVDTFPHYFPHDSTKRLSTKTIQPEHDSLT